MEICPVSGCFPANSLRFGQVWRRFSIQVPSHSNYEASSTSTNLRYHVDSVKSESSRNRMFILGMGFVGQYFAQELTNQGWIVSGTCTSAAKKKKLEEMGFTLHIFNSNEPEPEVLNILKYYTHLLISIPPVVGIGEPMLQHSKLLKSRLKDGNLRWLCYLSSTSVYGNCGGAWVDEDYPISCTSESGKARLAAEEWWLNFGRELGLATQVFRLGGIYGPGRSAIDTIIKREPLSEVQRMRSSRQYTSRVHVSDICQALSASIHKPSTGNIYNIVDDDPAPREEVFSFAQKLVEKKWPSQTRQLAYPDNLQSSIPKASSRGEKRVLNTRMKKKLGVQLQHPSYRSGLQSILEHMDPPLYTQ